MEGNMLNGAALSIDDQLNELKTKKANIGKLFDIEISKLEIKKNTVKSRQDEISSIEKADKIREDLVRGVLTDKSGSFTGGSVDQLIAVEPEAQGLKMLSLGK